MSSAASQRTLRDAIRDRQFAAVYYLYGEDDFLKDHAIRQLIDAALDPTLREFNLQMQRGSDVDAETLGSLLGMPPLMADRRVIVVRDVGSLRKDARKTLDKYLEAPAQDTTVILVSPAGAKTDKALLGSATPLEFEPLTGDRVPKWIVYHAEQELGTSITPEAVALLQNAVSNDLAQLSIELDKLASFSGGEVIDENAVTAIVGVQRTETLGAFLDAVAMRDSLKALKLLPGLLSQPKVSAVTVIMALTVQTLAIAWIHTRRHDGLATGRMTTELFGLLKEAGSVYTGRAWGDAVTAWVGHVSRQPTIESRRYEADLEALLVADIALKESRISSDEQLLASLVLTMCRDDSHIAEHAML